MLKFFRYGFSVFDSSKLSRTVSLVGTSRYSSSTSSDPSAAQKLRSESPEETEELSSSLHQEPLKIEEDPAPSQQTKPRENTIYRNQAEENFTPYRYVFPEFLPDPNLAWRNRVREKLERLDMLRRRSNIDIPEFYVGSILSVTVSDRNAPGKTTTFVGLCIARDETALCSTFTLRNVIDGHGVEVCYDLYNPTILSIMCLRLEKRLDDNLKYLRDAPLEYSTFPFDMIPELRAPDAPVPINAMKVKLNPRPWCAKWHLWDLKGIEDVTGDLEPWRVKKWNTYKRTTGFDVYQYDLMRTYRQSIPAEEQTEIYSEVHQELANLTASLRKQRRKRTFVKPTKTV